MTLRNLTFALGVALCPVLPAHAEIAPRDGWVVIDTAMPFDGLVEAVKASVAAHEMNVVTEAGPTAAAAKLGVTLPGNRVIGVFHARFAIRILPLSTAAMIEAPIRFYVTEETDGTATLSWKEPSFVLAPYTPEGGADLALPYPWLMRNDITVRGKWMYPRWAPGRLVALVRAGLLDLDQFLAHALRQARRPTQEVARPLCPAGDGGHF